jgi:choline monooxygenase
VAPVRSGSVSTDTSPTGAAATWTLPASWYHDPAIWERERTAVFGREWQYAGHVSQLAEPGQYLLADVAGIDVLVMTGADGVIRAFHNVCLHRAGPLVWDREGRCGNLVCRYHGWAYDLEGRLRSARDFGTVDGFEPEAFTLLPVRSETWRGLVFVNLAEQRPTLGEWLGSLAHRCEEFPLESYAWHSRAVHPVAANWKTYGDNYSEGYHVPTVHPGLNREIDSKRYEVVLGDGGRWTEHRVPARDGAPTVGRWLFRYPNLAINLYPTGMNLERWIPRGPRHTDVVFEYFFAPGHDAEAAASMASSASIMGEDREICEAVQRNLESGVYDVGLLSPRHEMGLAAVHRLVRQALGENVQEPADRSGE